MFSYKHSFSPIHGRGGTKENEPLEYTTKCTNRKVITGEAPVQACPSNKRRENENIRPSKNFL
ncbi:hypothetical protein ACJ64_04085 [Bacillus safensis]|nr:hypothetical protein ACJ64_04085 [Bacillus safensis]